jgi:murein DD-endopeptidase MepM/ murein hydrolase activator NlpD
MYKYRRIIVSAIAGLLIISLLLGIVMMVVQAAKSVSEIEEEIDELQAASDALAEEREALEKQIEENRNKTLTIVEQKAQVDMDIELTRKEVENVNDQIHAFNLLIAEKQVELDELRTEQAEMMDRYRVRMRSMQERGNVSVWEVLLQAKSFADMLNCRVMVEEIARADQRMMDNVRTMAAEILQAKDELAQEKVQIELKKAELAESEELLAAKRAESDRLLAELNANKQRLVEECEKYEQQEEELSNQIAELEAERTELLYQQWLEEQKRKEEEENKNNNNNNGGSTVAPPASGEGFCFPMMYCTMLTSAYGYRVHPITGNYTFHNGVDLAAGTGTPIYATKSGTVTTATYNYAYGYYVVVNHLDGFSSLYGHMTHYTVSEGDYVSRGEIIGYVGSTGYSTGPHLHFTIYYNGSTVNPMNYIRLP